MHSNCIDFMKISFGSKNTPKQANLSRHEVCLPQLTLNFIKQERGITISFGDYYTIEFII